MPRGAAAGLDPVLVGNRAAGSSTSLLGELRHVYLLPDLPADILATSEPVGPTHPELEPRRLVAAARPDASWEQVFEHVRRLIDGDHRSAA
jgi:hypothetical protein